MRRGAKCAQECVEGDSVHLLPSAWRQPALVAVVVAETGSHEETDLAKTTAETMSQVARASVSSCLLRPQDHS